MKATDNPVMLTKMNNGWKIGYLPECQLALNLFGFTTPDIKFTSFSVCRSHQKYSKGYLSNDRKYHNKKDANPFPVLLRSNNSNQRKQYDQMLY